MPDDPVVQFRLGGACLEVGQAEAAIFESEETIRLKPGYTAARRGLGRALAQVGRYGGAQAAYRRGLAVAARTGLPPSPAITHRCELVRLAVP